MRLGGIRKFEQVVTSVLSITKGKEAQGAIAVSFPKLSLLKRNGVTVRSKEGRQHKDGPKFTQYPYLG